jgi:AAA+ superfamily predicted ATPase
MCQNVRVAGSNDRELGLVDVNKYIHDANLILPSTGDDVNRKILTGAEELDQLIGLSTIKRMIKKIRAYAKKNSTDSSFNLHMCFLGNPGTGKTEVARILSRILYDAGILPEAKLIETNSVGLIGQYVGETGQKTNHIIQDAMGGVLFIDEAYAITDGRDGTGANDYGKEAISVLIKMMEDHKDRLVVIFAGYKEKMERFVKANEGMQSRIGYTFNFEDYNDKELLEIFCKKAKKAGLVLGKGVREKVETIIKDVPKGKNFGNGRFIDKLLQEVLIQHAMNLSDIEKMKKLSIKDIPEKELIFEKAFGSNKKMTLYDKTEIGFMAESKNKTAVSNKKE